MTKLSSEIRSVSVVMCTYNGEKYIREQLDSILRQTYPIEKIYIQDDCSTDKTVEIIKEYAEKHSNLFYKINKAQLGVNQNFLRLYVKLIQNILLFLTKMIFGHLIKLKNKFKRLEIIGYVAVFPNLFQVKDCL